MDALPRDTRGRVLAFEATDEQREIVSELSGLGTRHVDICRFIKDANGKPISVDTLTKHFGEELEHGRAVANGKVASTLFKMAISGLSPASTFFWLKTRAGWRETPQAVAFTNPDGSPMAPPSLADFYAGVQVVKAAGQAATKAADGEGNSQASEEG